MADLSSLIRAKLAERGHRNVADTASLFTSGLLDSMAAVEVMMMLESEFGIDLSDADFDISKLDTIADLEALVTSRKAA